MFNAYDNHNLYKTNGLAEFQQLDPHLHALSQLKYQYSPTWWNNLSLETPGIYILTGGRQVGKSTSCKLLITHCLKEKKFDSEAIFYLPCDEIFDAKDLSRVIRSFLDKNNDRPFLLIVDEVTFVKEWDRVIKALADEGHFARGLCLLTGSDTLILKEAAMRFPGRRGNASQVDFHVYPLSFSEYVDLVHPRAKPNLQNLSNYFNHYLQCGGYLRAINNLAVHGEILPATFLTYEQWIRGDFLKHKKTEENLLNVLHALLTTGVSQISYSGLTQKIGLISKDTTIDYCRLLERMDILIDLQAFDQNKKQGFPRKARKFHFFDPFIYQTILRWLQKEGYLNHVNFEAALVESCVASHCHRYGKTFYFKGQGEIDVIWLRNKKIKAIEVKWSENLRSVDLKMLKHFEDSTILRKSEYEGEVDGVVCKPIYQFLYHIAELGMASSQGTE